MNRTAALRATAAQGGSRSWVLRIAGLLVAAGCGPAMATSLGADIVIDPASETVFVVDPAGFAQAVAVSDGRLRWASTEQATPIALVSGRLLALGTPPLTGLGMLMVLDPATGATSDRVAFDVPEFVDASPAPRPLRRFAVQLVQGAAGLRVYWHDAGRPLRGALIDEDADGNLDREREAREAQGAFDIVIDQRRTFAVALPDAAPPPIAAGPALSEAEALPGVAGRQFRAADDASVLASVAEPDAALATVYRWSIHARADGKALGTLRSPYSYAPFIVRGSLLIYRAEPVLTQRGETSLALGSRLVAFDLETGVERWSVPVRDAQFLGPIPP